MKTKLRRFGKPKTSKPMFGKSEDSFFPVQTRLKVGQPGDKYEQEADKIADQVVSKSNESKPASANQFKGKQDLQEKTIPESITPLIQSKDELEGTLQLQPVEEEEEVLQMQTEEEEEMVQTQPLEEEEEMLQAQVSEEEEDQLQLQALEEEEEMLQAQAEEEEEVQAQEEEEEEIQPKISGESKVTPGIEKTLHSEKGSGKKMDNTTRVEMENSFGADFSGVNIHTNEEAVKMNQKLGAQAFTHGNDIFFNKGKYDPESNSGKHLLAHELTHTIQQTGIVTPQLQFTIGDNNDLQSARFSGDLVLEACLDGERTLRFGNRGAAVSKMQQALVDAGFPLPVYGVDGIFEAETQGALQNFQRSSSLTPSGVLNSSTMSALDALFAYGSPVLPSGPPANVAPTISSETIKLAPEDGDLARTRIGVGERVRFTGNTAGTWTASEGRIIGINNGENMVWEAPAVAASPTITLTTPAGSASMNMQVIAPNSLTMTVIRNEPIAVGTAGACMINDVVVHPLNVSFGRTQWFEVPGPATNVTGYFNRFSGAQLFHNPNPNYLPFDDNNTGLTDHAAMHGAPAPHSDGTFEWVVPNRYKIDGESDAQGRFFTNTTQSFYITSSGTVLITKAGTFVLRFINNTIL